MENTEGALKVVKETKEQYKAAMSMMGVEHDQRVQGEELLWIEINRVDSEAIEFCKKSNKRFKTFHNVLQDQTKSITEEFWNMGCHFDEQQRMIMEEFGMQQTGLWVSTNTTNEGTVLGDINTSQIIHSRKRIDTGAQSTGVKKRVTETTNPIGSAIHSFSARLQQLNELTSPVQGAQNITQTQATPTSKEGIKLVDDDSNYNQPGHVDKKK